MRIMLVLPLLFVACGSKSSEPTAPPPVLAGVADTLASGPPDGASLPEPVIEDTGVDPQGAPSAGDASALPFTPPRPLPEGLVAAGERCVAGEGAACDEVTTGLMELRPPWVLVGPWAARACELGVVRSCAKLGAHVFSMFKSRVEQPPGGAVPRAELEALLYLCERGDWKTCANLASLYGLAACPRVRTAFVLAEWEPNPVATQRALDLARPAAQAACEREDFEACEWLSKVLVAECGLGEDRVTAQRYFERAVSQKVQGCRRNERDACASLDASCDDFRRAIAPGVDVERVPADELVAIPLSWARASSSLPPWKDFTFDVDQIRDGRLETSWQPLDKRKGGVGQWVELGFPTARVVTAVAIANGMQRQDQLGDLFLLNGRAREVRFVFSDHTYVDDELSADRRGYTRFDLNYPKVAESIRVELRSVWPGDKWKDVAISEIEIFGHRDIAVALPEVCGISAEVSRRHCAADDVESCARALRYLGGDLAAKHPLQTLIIAEAEARCAAKDPAGCLAAAVTLVQRDGPSARAAKLANAACALGSFAACGDLGCRGDSSVGWLAGPPFGAAPGVCRKACEAGETASCLALAEQRDPEVMVSFDLASNVKLRASLRDCEGVDACLARATELDGRDYRELVSDPANILYLIAAAEVACDGGAARGCAILASQAQGTKLGDKAAARACVLEPGTCGELSAPELPTPEQIAEHFARCGRYESRSCELGCHAIELGDDLDAPDLSALAPYASPEVGMTPAQIHAVCVEYDLLKR